MKKYLLCFIICLVTFGNIYSQEDLFSQMIEDMISILGGVVPSDFQRLDRTTFKNDEGIILMVENGAVIVVAFGDVFDTTHEAHGFNGLLYDYFENTQNNWIFNRQMRDGTDIYLRNGVFGGITRPNKRDDGLIATGIIFTRNINLF